jgi:hypothetical protein
MATNYMSIDQVIRDEFPGKVERAFALGMPKVMTFGYIRTFSETQYNRLIEHFTEGVKICHETRHKVEIFDDSVIDFTEALCVNNPKVNFTFNYTYYGGKIKHRGKSSSMFCNLDQPNTIVCAYLKSKETV